MFSLKQSLVALVFLMVIVINNFADINFIDAPTGERIWWKWFDRTLIVMDSNGQCLANSTGMPVDCDKQEKDKMLRDIVKLSQAKF